MSAAADKKTIAATNGDRSQQNNPIANSTENSPLVPVPIDLILQPWFRKKVEGGFGGDYNDLETLAATLIVAEEELPSHLPPGWCFDEHPVDYYRRFAQESRVDAEDSLRLWRHVESCLEAFRGKQKLRPLSEILTAVAQLRLEEPADEDLSDLAAEVAELSTNHNVDPCVGLLLSPTLTSALGQLAQRLNIPLAAFVGVLLPITASLLKVGTQIEIDAVTNFYPPPILWLGLVADSGAAKSPVFDTLIRPLKQLQTEAETAHRQALSRYEVELHQWEQAAKEARGEKPQAPVPLELYVQDATIEALAEVLSHQPERGIIQTTDELAASINGLNQYKPGGKGADRQKWLSLYDGRGLKVNRKGDRHKPTNRLIVPRTAVSLVGTIQPAILRRLMGNTAEVDGFWARFCWIKLPLTQMPPPGEFGKFDLGDMLVALYRSLSDLQPMTYTLDAAGRSLWREWHLWAEDQKFNEPRPALQAIYPKARERAARIALVIHCLNAVFERRVPDSTITAQTLSQAIAFTRWTIGQALLVYTDVGVVDHPETARILRFCERFKDSKWITKRDVQRWYGAKPQIKAEQAQQFMQKLIDLGYAVSNEEVGRQFQIRLIPDIPDKPNAT